MHSYYGHVHYFNKLGYGDSQNDFRSIDWTLIFNEAKRGWEFLYHSFNPLLPEYADGWVEFRDVYGAKDQTVRYRAHAAHVLGRLVQAEELGIKDSDQNAIIYDNAFGEGIDYILYFPNDEFKKTVRIREGSKESKEYTFDFDIEFPENCTVNRGFSPTEIAYELNLSGTKLLDTGKETLIKTANGDTMIRPFRVWDSKTSSIISVEYSNVDGHSQLKKIIPASFIDSSIGDVWTDTTTANYDIGTGCGSCDTYQANVTWDFCHDQASAKTGRVFVNGSGVSPFCGFACAASSHWISRMFMPCDTSGLPDTATVTAASFFGKLNSYAEAGTPGSAMNIGIVGPTTQGAFTTLVEADYSQCGSINSPTAYSTAADLHAWSTTVYNEIVLNAAGISAISLTGYTPLGFRIKADIDDTDPGITKSGEWHIEPQSVSAKKPYLAVTYSDVASSNSNFLAFM